MFGKILSSPLSRDLRKKPHLRCLWIRLCSRYNVRSISGTLDKWNLHKMEQIFPVPWIWFIKSFFFESDNWNPRLVERSISWTIFLVQWDIFSRISGTFLKNHLKERSNYFYVFESSGKTFDFYEWKHESYITRHILKMAAVQTSKRRLVTVTLVDKYKALKKLMEVKAV